MSYVTNYILSFSICEEENDLLEFVSIIKLNKALRADDKHWEGDGGFKCIDKCAGGRKRMEATVFGYAANYYSPEFLMKAVVNIKWAFPEEVQLFVKDQEDGIFSIYNLEQMEEKCHSNV